MKVKELIEVLQKLDPEKTVMVYNEDNSAAEEAIAVKDGPITYVDDNPTHYGYGQTRTYIEKDQVVIE